MGCTSSRDHVLPATAFEGQVANWHEVAPRSTDGTANSAPAHDTWGSDERSPSLRVNRRNIAAAPASGFVLAPNPLRGATYNLDNDALPPHADARPFRASYSADVAEGAAIEQRHYQALDARRAHSNSTSAYLSRSALEAAASMRPAAVSASLIEVAPADSPVTSWLQALPVSPMDRSLRSMDEAKDTDRALPSLSLN